MKKNSQLQAIQQLISGIGKRLTSGSLVLASQTFTGPQLVAVLQPLADALTADVASRAAYRKSVADGNAAFAKANPVLVALQQALYVSFGNDAGALADFGLSPRTRRQPSAAVKSAAAVRAVATKKARGEMGSRQRESIEAPAIPAATPTPPASGTATK